MQVSFSSLFFWPFPIGVDSLGRQSQTLVPLTSRKSSWSSVASLQGKWGQSPGVSRLLRCRYSIYPLDFLVFFSLPHYPLFSVTCCPSTHRWGFIWVSKNVEKKKKMKKKKKSRVTVRRSKVVRSNGSSSHPSLRNVSFFLSFGRDLRESQNKNSVCVCVCVLEEVSSTLCLWRCFPVDPLR